MRNHAIITQLLGLALALLSSAEANPLPLPRDANMYLIHEKVTVQISGQTAVVTGNYKFKVPAEGSGEIRLYLPVYASPNDDKQSMDAMLISELGIHKMSPSESNYFVRKIEEAGPAMPGLEGQEVRWLCAGIKNEHREAMEVDYFIHYRQALSRGRFIYTPLIPNMITDHDYGTITIKSDDGFKLLDQDGHQFEEAPGQIIVKPAHKRAIIVESHGPRRAWVLENEFREKLSTTKQARHEFILSFADGLTKEDVVQLCRHGNDQDLLPEGYRRWGKIDHRSALAHMMGLVGEVHHRAKGTEDGELRDWESMVSHKPFLKVLEGWSQADPKGAWEAYNNMQQVLNGRERSKTIAVYPYDLSEPFFSGLARVDAPYALEELLKLPADAYYHSGDPFEAAPIKGVDADRLLQRRIKGFCAGAPDGSNWALMMDRFLASKHLNYEVEDELSTSLLGRWLKDDADGAGRWFKAGNVKGLHWYSLEELDPFLAAAKEIPEDQLTKVRHHMGRATGYWASMNLADAWKWVREYYPSKPDQFGIQFYQGYQHGKGVFRDENELDRTLAMDVAKLPKGERLEFVKDVWVPVWKMQAHFRSVNRDSHLNLHRDFYKKNEGSYERYQKEFEQKEDEFDRHVAACLKSAEVDGDIWTPYAGAE
jgi:hypothetical protein